MQDTMTRTEELQCIFWDMYKDAYGFRPRHVDTSLWDEADFEAEFEQLALTIQRENIARLAAERKAMHDFEMRVLSLLQTGAKDRDMALRWIHEAEGTQGDDEFLCFELGLPYRYFKETV